ncbi:MAG: InlB B-repeat-containing protein [Clostridia bacterium]|nr:InlB B-repeat-containing protein [Clostridia bacterium]
MAIIAVVCAFAACKNGDDKDPVTKYTVTYSAGEGGGTAPNGGEYAEGATFTLPAATGLSREGYDFDKWNDGTTDYAVGATYTMPAKNVTFTAKWVESVVKYTVTYVAGEDAEGTVPDGGEYAAGATFELPEPTELTNKEGYLVAKWNDGTTDYAAGATYTMPERDVTFTAVWGVPHTVTFKGTFRVEENSVPAAKQYAEGATVTLPENTMTMVAAYQNYVFTGWKTGSTTYQPGESFIMPADDVEITAQWVAGVSVAFNLNGGTGDVPANKYYAKGSTVTLPTSAGLNNPGYILTGWNAVTTDSDGNTVDTEKCSLGGSYTVGNYDVTFTAIWSDASVKYTITVFKSNVESEIDSVQGTLPTFEDKAAGETFTAPEEGLTFAHRHIIKWWVYVFETDQLGNADWVQKTSYNPGETITMPGCNIQLKPRWVANDVTISFDANGGTGEMTPITKAYNAYLTLPANGFTAPDGKTFQGWASSENGSILTNSTKLEEPLVNADDTLTLYAVWETSSTTPVTIDAMVGHWTATGHTLDIIADETEQHVLGYGILDGQYFVKVQETGTIAIGSLDGDISYALALNDTSLTLTPSGVGTAITFTEKGVLTPANRNDFVGKWKRDGNNHVWVINDSAVAYGSKALSPANSVIIGDKIALWYDVAGYNYDFVLQKSGDELVGYYDANGHDPEAVTFNANLSIILTVDGTPNQVVANGIAPDESMIQTPTAPEEGKVFDKWVLAGTETEFDPTAAMTADASIVATWKDDSGTTYTGRYVHSSGSGFFAKNFTVVKIELKADHSKLTYTLDTGVSKTVNLTVETQNKPNNYGDDAEYYSVSLENVAHYLLVKADGSKILLCDDYDEPIEGAEFSVSNGESDWDIISTSAWSSAGTKYFTESFTNGGVVFLGIQFVYDTNFSNETDRIKIKPIYVSNEAERVGTNISFASQNDNCYVFTSTSYIVTIGMKDGIFYIVSFSYKNNPDTTERALTGTTAPSWQ